MARGFAGIAGPFYLALCILFGGSSMGGAMANALLQATGVLLIVLCLWGMRGARLAPEARGLSWIVGAYLLLVVLMLIPLPADLWASLPGRALYRDGLAQLGISDVAQPLTLDRDATLASILSLLPPAAMFLLVSRMDEEMRRRLPWVVIGLAIVSVVLGAFQLMGGPTSPLRLYSVTSPTLPVGFFANANHLATLALCSLPFAGWLAARAATRTSDRAKRSSAMVVAIGVGLFLCVGIAVIGSLAGYALFPIAAVASALVYRRATGGALSRRWLAGLGALFALFLAFSLVGPINQEVLAKKEASGSSRRDFAARTVTAIGDYAPLGTGLGTYQNVYRLYDDPARTDRHYVNHAHNDYLEVALELGVPGVLLILAFLAWWARRTWAVWTSTAPGGHLARAAAIPIAIVLLHSVVDYPIRTAAIAAIFAAACALLVPYRSTAAPRAARATNSASGLRHIEAD